MARSLGRCADGDKHQHRMTWQAGAAVLRLLLLTGTLLIVPLTASAGSPDNNPPPLPGHKPLAAQPATKALQDKPISASTAKPQHPGMPPVPLPRPANPGKVAATVITASEGAHDLKALLPAPDADDIEIYRAAFAAIEQKHWAEAYRVAQQARQSEPAKLINWMRLSEAPDSKAGFGEISDFIQQNPDWPGQSSLRAAAEFVMPADLPEQQVIDWFRSNPPQTLPGTRRYVTALNHQHLDDEATTAIRQRWIDGPVPSKEQARFLAEYGRHLTKADHETRLDRLIWDEQFDAAHAMLRYVSRPQRLLAEARLSLAQMQPGVDSAVSRVPPALRDDPGLLYERTRWRRRKEMDSGAADMILAADKSNTAQSDWWSEREILARRLLDADAPGMAYKVAAGHDYDSGLEFATLEWLSGWIALRALDKPALALPHFKKLYRGVTTPISLARASYWAGRAAEAGKDRDQALAWYRRATSSPTTFYGQLAANRAQWLMGAREPATLDLKQKTEPERAQRTAFSKNEFVRIINMLDRIGGKAADQLPLFMAMMRRSADSEADYRLIGELAMALKRPNEAIKTAKAAASDGYILSELGYPTLGFNTDSMVETPLVHAVIRQESEFNPAAQSRVGALGLMQLMPKTARHVASKANLPSNTNWLISRPDYNVRLGTLYLRELLDRYDGSYVLTLAAYNAGPSRVDEWIDKYGDPRHGQTDVIDWIERIPYRETRNYIQRILESTQVYRARLAGGTAPVMLDHDLMR